MFDTSDAHWRRFGKEDPYFGVVSHDTFHAAHLDEAAKRSFFATGEQHVGLVLQTIRDHLDPSFKPRRSLDFGCGVGRLLLPLAAASEQVEGIDISDGMLLEARNNCRASGVSNVTVFKADDELTELGERRYDFIHSFIVFQHIRPRRGERLMRRLLGHLDSNGVAALHVTYQLPLMHRLIQLAVRHLPLAGAAKNLLRGRSAGAPRMDMNSYDIGRLLRFIAAEYSHSVFVQLTNHSGHGGAMLYFRKT